MAGVVGARSPGESLYDIVDHLDVGDVAILLVSLHLPAAGKIASGTFEAFADAVQQLLRVGVLWNVLPPHSKDAPHRLPVHYAPEMEVNHVRVSKIDGCVDIHL